MAPLDVIVLGTGGIGSAALSALARRGASVLGLDQFPPAHDQGSSHGQTRLIRQAYYEHPDYVPLVRRAYDLWDELSARRGVQLFRRTGLLQAGPADGPVVEGTLASAQRHNLPIESLKPDDIQQHWPGFVVPQHFQGIYEPQAGVLAVEQCVTAHLEDAQAHGARLITGEAALAVQVGPDGVTVETAQQKYAAHRLVIAAGPWASRWLSDLGISLVVRRKPLFWFATRSPAYRASDGCPAFLFETSAGVFYGFPELERGELKIAEHSGGDTVLDPAAVDRNVHADDQARLESFIRDYLPGVSRTRTNHVVCMYTMSVDEHFIVDRHPEQDRVCFVAGLSGHGFKFAPVLGEALADLALEGRSMLPIQFFSCRRAALHTR
ncbi:MAG TPA: N-methyl-L-tryptophan oxidase [Pirellulales bacterium]